MKNFGTAIILAGGRSKRMGFDKIDLKYQNEKIIHLQIKALKNMFDEIIVVTNNNDFKGEDGIIILQDEFKDIGPLAGLHAGLKKSSSKFGYFLACDMPFIDVNYIREVMETEKIEEYDALLAKTNGFFEPFNGFYKKDLYLEIEDYLLKKDLTNNQKSLSIQMFIRNRKIFEISEKLINRYDKRLFININTKGDIKRYLHEHKEVTNKINILQIKDGQKIDKIDEVVCEYQLHLFINNCKFITLNCTPSNLKELIVGYLFSEQIIYQYSDIIKIDINYLLQRANIIINNEFDLETLLSNPPIKTTGCGTGFTLNDENISVISDYSMKYDHHFILEKAKLLNTNSELYLRTGGVHSTMLTDAKEEIIFFEDVGRHNAVDKIVGYSLINKIDLTDKILFTSGRISSEMIIKSAKVGVHIVVSRSAPTSLAIEKAYELNITLIGFVRGKRMNIYTNHEKIT